MIKAVIFAYQGMDRGRIKSLRTGEISIGNLLVRSRMRIVTDVKWTFINSVGHIWNNFLKKPKMNRILLLKNSFVGV